ncbi:MAG: hypothetical protein FJ297_17780 [Planctomycetes bacterium]|nr:hypothetical protein [Planctomycetota bacterium]
MIQAMRDRIRRRRALLAKRRTAPSDRRSRRLRLGFEPLEQRALLASVHWDGGGGDFMWQNDLNWDTDLAPQSGDDVFVTGSGFIVESDSHVDVNSVTSDVPLEVASGVFDIHAYSRASAVTVSGGGLLKSMGGGSWDVGGTTSLREDGAIEGLSLFAHELLIDSNNVEIRSSTIVVDIVTVVGADDVRFADSSIVVEDQWDHQTDADLIDFGSSPTDIRLNGQFAKSLGGSGLTVIEPRFHNNGTVYASSGTIRFSDLGVSWDNGRLSDGEWVFAGGTIEFPGPGPLTDNVASITIEGAASPQSALSRLEMSSNVLNLNSDASLITAGDFQTNGDLYIDWNSTLGVGAVPLTGLAAQWHAENNAYDAVGSLDGVPVDNTTYTPGKVGQAFLFDNAGDYITFGDPVTGEVDFGAGDFTISMWVKPETYAGALINKGSNAGLGIPVGSRSGYFVYLNSNGTVQAEISSWDANSQYAQVVTTDTIPLDAWTHVAIVRTAADLRVYFNGIEKATTPTGTVSSVTDVSTDAPLRVGARDTTAIGTLGAFFDGALDDITMHARALSHSQITTMIAGGTFTQGIGTTSVFGKLFANEVAVYDGNLWVNGAVFADVVNAGTIASAAAPSPISIDGSYEQTASGVLRLELDGYNPGEFDSLEISSDAPMLLDGALEVHLGGGYTPDSGEVFLIIQQHGFGAISGTFDGLPDGAWFVVDGFGFQIDYSDNDVVLTSAPDDLLVTTTSDSGAGSLRQAILDANTIPGEQRILFTIPGLGPYLIQPTSALPSITDRVTIDGHAFPDLLGAPNVEIRGLLAGGAADGLHVAAGADYSSVSGLIINQFGDDGIVVDAANVTIAGNRIGTDAAGSSDAGNGGDGLDLASTAHSSTVFGNVLSGNSNAGIRIASDDNHLYNNTIGLDAMRTAAIGNFRGIEIVSGASYNLIGGATAPSANVVSGNANDGIFLNGVGTSNNRIFGNKIGTNGTGLAAIANAASGVAVTAGASGNTIGTDGDGLDDAAESNQISGNGTFGVWIHGSATTGNTVAGNRIGTNPAGTAAIANVGGGVGLYGGAHHNRVGTNGDGVSDVDERNLISGNGGNGVTIADANTDMNSVAGNYIGTDSAGAASIKNAGRGVWVLNGPSHNTIGGLTDSPGTGLGNVVSGNLSQVGVVLEGSGTEQNTVAGNLIGLAASGYAALPNAGGIWTNASYNTIGGVDPRARNVVSGNTGSGIVFNGASDNAVLGNYVGTDRAGVLAVGNTIDGVRLVSDSSNNMIGGPLAAERNLISGNAGVGIHILSSSYSNTIENNYIGVAVTGLTPLPNGASGVLIDGAHNNRIGTDGDGVNDGQEGNVIAANGGSLDANVKIINQNALNTVIAGNRIGTDALGNAAIANPGPGIWIENITRHRLPPSPNRIGGLQPLERNIINGAAGTAGIYVASSVEPTEIEGNYIGVNSAGTAVLGNAGDGIHVFSSLLVSIGGAEPGAGNVISGNVNGITLTGDGTTEALVKGNIVGLDADGTTALGNSAHGIWISYADANAIGGTDAADRNVIAGNAAHGIAIEAGSDLNTIAGNFIGVNAAGTAAIGNSGNGIHVSDSSNQVIGGTVAGAGNVISGNTIGIAIAGSTTTGVQVLGNLIGLNADGTSALGNSQSGVRISFSELNYIGGTTVAERNVIAGNATHGVEIFGDSNVVQGNFIGTDITGTTAVSNGSNGVYIASDDNRIGGIEGGAGNVISGNGFSGVRFDAGSYNDVFGNLIGTDATGTQAIGNRYAGVTVQGSYNRIGGPTPAHRNVISGTWDPGSDVRARLTINYRFRH